MVVRIILTSTGEAHSADGDELKVKSPRLYAIACQMRPGARRNLGFCKLHRTS